MTGQYTRKEYLPDLLSVAENPSFNAQLLEIRQREIVPGLEGATALDARPLGDAGASARWRLGNGRLLQIDVNFADASVDAVWPLPSDARMLFEHPDDAPGSVQSAASESRRPPASIRVFVAPLP